MRTEIVGDNRIEFTFDKTSCREFKTNFRYFGMHTYVTPEAIKCLIGQPIHIVDRILSVLRREAKSRPIAYMQNVRINGKRLIFWDMMVEFWLATEEQSHRPLSELRCGYMTLSLNPE